MQCMTVPLSFNETQDDITAHYHHEMTANGSNFRQAFGNVEPLGECHCALVRRSSENGNVANLNLIQYPKYSLA